MTRDEAIERMWVHTGALRAGVVRELGNAADAADVIQDALLYSIRFLERNEILNPEGFVHNAVRCRVMNFVRDRTNATGQRRLVELKEWAQTPDRRDIAAELVRADLVQTGLKGLGRLDREVLTMSCLEEQPAEVVCIDLGLSPSRLRNRKHRAKKRFAENLRRVA